MREEICSIKIGLDLILCLSEFMLGTTNCLKGEAVYFFILTLRGKLFTVWFKAYHLAEVRGG